MKLTTTTSVSDWQSICGKRIGAVRGAFSQSLAASNLPSGCFSEVAYPSIAEMVLDLKNGRLDAVISARSLLRGFAANSEVSLTVSNDTVRPYSFGLAISKKNPALAKKISELTTSYVADGTMDRIMEKFGIQLDWSLMKIQGDYENATRCFCEH